MTPPTLVYLGMGLLVARIMLDGTQTRGFTWLRWLQFLVDAARITLLWPLVLLVEKIEKWLKPEAGPQPYSFPLSNEEHAHEEHVHQESEIEPAGGEKP